MAELDLSRLLIQLLVIVAGAGIFRWLAGRLGQPGILGEILLGLLLGPSFLGWVWPEAQAYLLGSENRAALEGLAWIGLVFFMYVAGAEMRWARGEGHTVLLVSLGGLLLPFVMGLALAMAAPQWFFGPEYGPRHMLLVAVVMTVSAIPVLARILEDVRLLDHPLGTIALGAGTVDDLVGWIVFGLVAGSTGLGLTGNLLANTVLLLALLAFALVVDRALRPWLARRPRRETPQFFVGLLGAILGSAWVTHAAGLHAVLGPLAVGALMSRHPVLRAYAQNRLRGVTLVLLLPTFFVLTGADTDLTLLSIPDGLLSLVVVALVASLAKVTGVYVGGRSIGLTRQASLVVGILMNARGAVGLVVAKVGHDTGLLSEAGFTLLVLVIALTTMAAPVALQWYARRLHRRAGGNRRNRAASARRNRDAS